MRQARRQEEKRQGMEKREKKTQDEDKKTRRYKRT